MAVAAIAVSPDSRYIATSGKDGTVFIWSGVPSLVPTIPAEMQCPEDNFTIMSLHFSESGDVLAACTEQSHVYIWHVSNGHLMTSFELPSQLRCCYQSSNNTTQCLELRMIVVGRKRMTARLEDWSFFSITTARIRIRAPQLPADNSIHPVSLESSPDIPLGDPGGYYGSGGIIVSSSSGNFIAVESPWSGVWNLWRRMSDSESAHFGYRLQQLTYADHPELELAYHTPCSVVFAGDELLIAGFRNGNIVWWDITSYPLHTTEPCGILALETYPDDPWKLELTMSPSSSLLVVVMHSGEDDSDELEDGPIPTIAVLRRKPAETDRCCPGDTPSDGFSLHVSLCGHTGQVNSVCISPCEQYVASASNDRTVRLWNIADGSLVWRFEDHNAEVRHVAFTPDGRNLVSAAEDGRVCMHALSMFVRSVPLVS